MTTKAETIPNSPAGSLMNNSSELASNGMHHVATAAVDSHQKQTFTSPNAATAVTPNSNTANSSQKASHTTAAVNQTASTTTTAPARRYSREDFEFSMKLGTGAYSTVYLTKFLLTGKKYATKVISKKLILKENKIKTIKMEKMVLNMMNHPNIISLFCTYQDKQNLYFVLELAPGGEMFQILSKHGPLSIEACQYYTAELVLGLEYMHSLGIIHRDLKPENIILSRTMHTKITDFGTAKLEQEDGTMMGATDSPLARRKGTFCGTAEYVSPETLRDEPVTMACDLWALGCIIYQYLTGKHPFKAESEYLIFQKILQKEMEYPEGFPPVAKDLIEKLLQLTPEDRLGYGGGEAYQTLKAHPFFNGIDWDGISSATPPEIVPYTEQPTSPSADSGPNEEDEESQESTKERLRRKTLSNISEEDRTRWAPFLLKGEVIIHTSQIVKRRRLSSKKRQLILTDHPRLLYIDTTKNVIKGSIPFTEELRVERKSAKFFNIRTPGRTYVLECVNRGADDWVKHLTECLLLLSKR